MRPIAGLGHRTEPIIIQGGMGVSVSSWPLARAVSETGQLGVVSGTALDLVLARRLQLGDPEGNLRRGLAAFPIPEVADRVLQRYFIPGGKAADQPFRPFKMADIVLSRDAEELIIVANFVEVYLAKEGHPGLVGINYLEKIQLPTLPSILGAMLARVDYVIMGAGIPRSIPGIIDRLTEGKPVELSLNVLGAEKTDNFVTRFDPARTLDNHVPFLGRPKFLAVVASSTLATMLARKATGHVDGFVIEGPTAGGHNAPPRGTMQLDDRGEPIYGKRDIPELKIFRDLGRPFWLAGSHGSPDKVVEALQAGATGVQVGTAFAFCDESGLGRDVKRKVLAMSRENTVDVRTDPIASPTGFPFKVLSMPDSLSDEKIYQDRHRVCDLGYLRHAYRKSDGTIGMRCPADKTELYVSKGGDAKDTVGRKCVCNGLMATAGMGQVRARHGAEPFLFTCGDEARNVAQFLPTPDAESYSAVDVIKALLADLPEDTGFPESSKVVHGPIPRPHEGRLAPPGETEVPVAHAAHKRSL